MKKSRSPHTKRIAALCLLLAGAPLLGACAPASFAGVTAHSSVLSVARLP